MDLGLEGRTAIVCGASAGIGLGIAEALADEGAHIVMFARRREVLEREALAAALAGPPCVLATGGGAVLDPDNRALMRRRGFVVHLRISVETQLARLAGDRSRPLIAGDDREAVLRRLAAEPDARTTRRVISPRLAMSTFLNIKTP